MSANTLANAAEELRAALVEVAWAQWAALGLPASVQREARSIVDPEALVLASLWLNSSERRLGKLNRMMAAGASRLLSAQRLRNLAADYPTQVQAGVAEIAAVALEEGKDARWARLARAKRKGAGTAASGVIISRYPPPALVFRLRLAFGVGIKADVLAFLIGRGGTAETVQDIATAAGYRGRAVRRALEELDSAGFLQARRSAPISYAAEEDRWAAFLGLEDGPPLWVYWQQLYAFGADLDATAEASRDLSTYLQSSRARDLMDRHVTLRVVWPKVFRRPEDFPGPAYLEALVQDVSGLSERARSNWI